MILQCKDCGVEIAVEHANLENLLAKCSECNSVFSFADDISFDPTKIIRKPAKRSTVPTVKCVRLSEVGPDLKIVQRWFSREHVAMVFFCIAWYSFLIFWCSIAFTRDASWIMIVFLIAHVVVGFGLTYFTLAGFLNRTIVSVNPTEVTVRHVPLPWKEETVLQTRDLEHFLTQEEANTRLNGASYTYQLSVLMKDGRKVKLLSNLPSPDVAFYIEERIESRLKIGDRPVQGKIPTED